MRAAALQQQGRSEAGGEGSHPSRHRRGGSGIQTAAETDTHRERVLEHVARGLVAHEQAIVDRHERDASADAHPPASRSPQAERGDIRRSRGLQSEVVEDAGVERGEDPGEREAQTSKARQPGSTREARRRSPLSQCEDHQQQPHRRPSHVGDRAQARPHRQGAGRRVDEVRTGAVRLLHLRGSRSVAERSGR